jgi:hypothetical protein
MGQKNCCAETEHKFNREHNSTKNKGEKAGSKSRGDLEGLLSTTALKTK